MTRRMPAPERPNPTDRSHLVAFVQVLATLPPDLREVYLLSARDGLSTDRIGERLGMSDADVTRTLAAALAALDRAIGSP